MRTCSTLFFLLAFISLSAKAGHAQMNRPEARITLKLRDAPLRLALQKVSAQTEMAFVYGDQLLENVKVSCDFRQELLEQALAALLAPRRLAFKKTTPKQIVIYKLAGAKKFSLSGVVLDMHNGEVLPYANVWLPGTTKGTSANVTGNFTLLDLPAQTCTLQVRYIGYFPQTIVIDPSRSPHDLRIPLQQTTVRAPDIAVRAESWEVFQVSQTAGEVAVSPHEFTALPIIGDKDLARCLQLMPGISTNNYGASGMHLRGGLPSQNLVLLDGMTLYQLEHAFGFFSAVNAEAIKDVRVYKSGFPAKFGGRLSGVMELTAKTGDFKRPRLSIGLNRLSSQLVAEVPLAGRGGILFSARRSISDYLIKDLYERVYRTLFYKVSPVQYDLNQIAFPDPSQVARMMYFYDVMGKLTLAPGAKNIFAISAYDGRDKINNLDDFGEWIIVDSLGQGWQSYSRRNVSTFGNKGLSIKWHRQWHPRFHSTALYAVSKYATQNFLQDIVVDRFESDSLASNRLELLSGYRQTIANRVEDHTARVDQEWQIHSHHKLEFGLSVTAARTRYVYEDENSLGRIEPVLQSFRQQERSQLRSAYVQDSWKPEQRIEIELGLRASRYDRIRSLFWEPRLSLAYNVTPNVMMKYATGRYHQYHLQFGDDFYVLNGGLSWLLADGEFIRPASARQHVAGGQYENQNFLLDIELYQKISHGVLDAYFTRQFYFGENNAAVYQQHSSIVRGMDLLLRKKTGKLSGWLSYSLSQARARFMRGENMVTSRSEYDRPHSLTVVGNYALGRWNFSAVWQIISGKPYNMPAVVSEQKKNEEVATYYFFAPAELNARNLPAAHRLDFSLTHLFSTRFMHGKVGLSVFNVYNRQNHWYRYFVIRDAKLQAQDVKLFGIKPALWLEAQF